MSIEAFAKNSLNGSGSNYDAALEKAAALFSRAGTDKMISKTGCRADEEYIYTELLGRSFRISRSSGRVEQLIGREYQPAGYDPAMVLYDLFAYSEKDAAPSGRYVQLQNHSQVQNVRSFAGEGAFDKYARLFTGHCAKLERVCAEMGGVPFGKGDVSLAIPYYRNLRIGLSFWDADDEFPAALYIFQDENAGAFMHYETMWYASGDLMSEITEAFNRT